MVSVLTLLIDLQLPTERTADSSKLQATAIMAASPKRVRPSDAKKDRSRERTKKSRTESTSSSRSSSAASGSSRSSSSSSSSSSRSTSVSPRRRRNRVSRSASGARGGGGDAGSRTNATSSSSSRRKRTPTPPRPCKIHVGRLTRNVTRDHLLEIFGCYGAVKSVELPPDRTHSHLSRGFAYIEFENPADAEKAMRHMDGGQIDGQEVTAASVLLPRPVPPRRPSPPMPPKTTPLHRLLIGGRSPPPRSRPRRSPPPRGRSGSPPPSRHRSPRPSRRSRSPVGTGGGPRRHARSSSSSSR
ncbi:hypothetical protein MRX96_033254 [Rhipicephalus microplus]